MSEKATAHMSDLSERIAKIKEAVIFGPLFS